MSKPILLFGYGNPSRGDDALGPLLLNYVENTVNPSSVEILTDFQLQIEHALDLENRDLVLFVDASVSCIDAFDFSVLEPDKDKSYTTHAMSPAAVLDVYREIKRQTPPPCFLLSIKGESFELGEGLSAIAEKNLSHACQFVKQLFGSPDPDAWRELANQH